MKGAAAIACLLVLTLKAMDVRGQTSAEPMSAHTLLVAFCKLSDKVKVMECVDKKTEGKALGPWNTCMNSKRDLSKDELVNLSCKALMPKFKVVHDVLITCVDGLMTSEEATQWMPIMESCGNFGAEESTPSAEESPSTSTATQ
uniref:U32-Liphistoxin-Lth1a_1 n=1 Tax=Liphistius thaleban TaxID=1905330 RepID=A0A4Q8K1K7_9ARAC